MSSKPVDDRDKSKAAFMQLYDDALEIYRLLVDGGFITDDAIECRLCPFLGSDCNAMRDVPHSVCKEEIFEWYLKLVSQKGGH